MSMKRGTGRGCRLCSKPSPTRYRDREVRGSRALRVPGLRAVLVFPQVEAARRMIAVAVVEKFNPREHEEKYWCHCCQEEVGRHISDGSVTVLYGGMLEHMCRYSTDPPSGLCVYEGCRPCLV